MIPTIQLLVLLLIVIAAVALIAARLKIPPAILLVLNRLGRPCVQVPDGYRTNPHPARTAVGTRIGLPVEQDRATVGLAVRDRCADPTEVEGQNAPLMPDRCRVQDEITGVLFSLAVVRFSAPGWLMMYGFVLRPPPWISAAPEGMPSVPGGAVLGSPTAAASGSWASTDGSMSTCPGPLVLATLADAGIASRNPPGIDAFAAAHR